MKKSEPTHVEKAIQTVDGFEKVYNTIKQQTILRGQNKCTLNNYPRRIAAICLHLVKIPE